MKGRAQVGGFTDHPVGYLTSAHYYAEYPDSIASSATCWSNWNDISRVGVVIHVSTSLFQYFPDTTKPIYDNVLKKIFHFFVYCSDGGIQTGGRHML